jgi:hypothetical protein
MRTAVVVSTATPLSDEEQLVARRIAGVLVGAGAEVLVAEPVDPPWQVGLPARRFRVQPARRPRRAALETVFGGGGGEQRSLDRVGPVSAAAEDAWLAAGGGASAELAAVLEDEFEQALLVGLTTRLTTTITETWRGRIVVLPLRTPPLERLPRARRTLRAADTAIAIRPDERRRLEAVGAQRAVDVGFALRVEATGTGRPTGAPEGPYVLAVAPWSDPVRGAALRRRAARFARRVSSRGALRVVLLTDGVVRPRDWPSEVVVRSAGSRRDLWAWMRGAVAVIDLDGSRYLARDAAESLLCGVPAVVPAGGAAHDLVERCGGGLWYRSVDDAALAVAAIGDDPRLRRTLGAQGHDGAAQELDLDTFSARVLEATALEPARR